jgi:hypothetical protein
MFVDAFFSGSSIWCSSSVAGRILIRRLLPAALARLLLLPLESLKAALKPPRGCSVFISLLNELLSFDGSKLRLLLAMLEELAGWEL